MGNLVRRKTFEVLLDLQLLLVTLAAGGGASPRVPESIEEPERRDVGKGPEEVGDFTLLTGLGTADQSSPDWAFNSQLPLMPIYA